jgi:MFS family permease
MMAWRHEITPLQWRVLFASHLGWLLDGFDVMLYAFALLQIKSEFNLSSIEAGSVASVTLLASAFGGALAGVFADRVGRARVLLYSIVIYSVCTGLTATATTIGALIAWRALVGIGLGAEWSAGSVLVSECWPAKHRGKASGLMQSGWALGYIFAALLSSFILPRFGWRTLFILGSLPALLVFWIRRNIPEPTIWVERRSQSRPSLFERRHLKNLILATTLTTSLLFAYWGLFTWLPSFLALPQSAGGAGLSVIKSLGWILPLQVGALGGYISFGFLADRFGRRATFILFVIISAVAVPLYGQASNYPQLLFILGPVVGFFGHGYFSLFGAYLSELFETGVRGSAQGFCYNFGRAISSLAPVTIGYLADQRGMGFALAFTSGFYILGAVIILFLPETRGEVLK